MYYMCFLIASFQLSGIYAVNYPATRHQLTGNPGCMWLDLCLASICIHHPLANLTFLYPVQEKKNPTFSLSEPTANIS